MPDDYEVIDLIDTKAMVDELFNKLTITINKRNISVNKINTQINSSLTVDE